MYYTLCSYMANKKRLLSGLAVNILTDSGMSNSHTLQVLCQHTQAADRGSNAHCIHSASRCTTQQLLMLRHLCSWLQHRFLTLHRNCPEACSNMSCVNAQDPQQQHNAQRGHDCTLLVQQLSCGCWPGLAGLQSPASKEDSS
jgi:hypothetical protein